MSTKTRALSKSSKASDKEKETPHRTLDALQRTVSLTTGAIMLIRAVRNKSLLRGLGAGYLIYRGATGTCPASEMIGQDIMDLNPLKA